MYTTFFILPPRNISDHSLRSSFNRIQTVYVCMCVYMRVCVSLLMIILKRVYYDLLCMYLVCQASSLSDHRSYLSSSVLFLGTLSDNQWKSMYFI